MKRGDLMSLGGNIARAFDSIGSVLVSAGKTVGPAASKTVNGIAKGGVKLAGKVLEGAEAVKRQDGKAFFANVRSKTTDVGRAFTKNVLTDDASYKSVGKIGHIPESATMAKKTVGYENYVNASGKVKQKRITETVSSPGRERVAAVGNKVADGINKITQSDTVQGVQFSKKFGLMDELTAHTRAAGNIGAKLGGAMFRKSETSMLGFEATGFGKAALLGGAALSGIPNAASEWNKSRQGMSDGQAVGHAPAPYVPAYMQNSGATGDLVFALNDLRRG
jgi:hypothetical protein